MDHLEGCRDHQWASYHRLGTSGIENNRSVADVVRHGRLRWFRHLERKGVDDWVSAFRNVEVVGEMCGQGQEALGRVCEKMT